MLSSYQHYIQNYIYMREKLYTILVDSTALTYYEKNQ